MNSGRVDNAVEGCDISFDGVRVYVGWSQVNFYIVTKCTSLLCIEIIQIIYFIHHVVSKLYARYSKTIKEKKEEEEGIIKS